VGKLLKENSTMYMRHVILRRKIVQFSEYEPELTDHHHHHHHGTSMALLQSSSANGALQYEST